MAEQVRKSRKQKPEPFFEGDQIRILPTSSIPRDRIGIIVMTDGQWCLVQIGTEVVWIPLKPV
ncbi:MAG: hypothetical protein NPIRA03_06700 [Nitrospirales bacterium]|nr:MAG: hypothetical protein NPIRA03_06700 [Nitrospirales bacterium]